MLEVAGIRSLGHVIVQIVNLMKFLIRPSPFCMSHPNFFNSIVIAHSFTLTIWCIFINSHWFNSYDI